MSKELKRVTAALLIGIILGLAGMNAYVSKEFERLSAKNKALEQQVRNQLMDLEELKAEKQQNNKIIKDIKVTVELFEDNNLPTFERTSVILDGESKIDNLLMDLKGQKINHVNYNLIPKMINGREFVSEGRRYILNTNVVIVTDELHIHATASLVKTH
ncbi:hypothetical protein V6C27_04405 [Peptococcaceae bacterium 1198_IL3148]